MQIIGNKYCICYRQEFSINWISLPTGYFLWPVNHFVSFFGYKTIFYDLFRSIQFGDSAGCNHSMSWLLAILIQTKSPWRSYKWVTEDSNMPFVYLHISKCDASTEIILTIASSGIFEVIVGNRAYTDCYHVIFHYLFYQLLNNSTPPHTHNAVCHC